MPRLNSAARTFPVADVGPTIRRYEAKLGFTIYPFPPHLGASVGRDDIEIMFQPIKGYESPDLYQRRQLRK